MAVAAIILSPETGWLAVGLIAALVLLSLASEVFKGRIDQLILYWAALFPLGGFIAFPPEHAIVTFERDVLFVAVIGLMFTRPSTLVPIPRPFRKAGLAGGAFIAVAGLTILKLPDPLNPARNLIDCFLVPLGFAWIVLAWCDVRRWIPRLHTAVCTSSIISAAIAAVQVVTGKDLMGTPATDMSYAGDIPRANGPFATNDELALIGGISLFFLLFLRTALGRKISVGRRLFHSIGLAAAVGMTLMPMFRSVLITLVIVLVIDTFWEKKAGGRAGRIALIAAIAGSIFVGSILLPQVFEDRSGAENGYARVAQYEQNFKVFADHPLLGVGFFNFHNYVSGESEYVTSYGGVQSVDWPHSNLGEALTETGLAGFVPYIALHVLLVTAMWQLRRKSASGRLVWKFFFFMLLIYWIPGLEESSGFEPSVNTWYAFAAAVLYKYALTEPFSPPAENQFYERGLRVPARAYSPAVNRSGLE
jgi:hypothetical protein